MAIEQMIPAKRTRGPRKSTNNPEIDAIPAILAILKPLSGEEQDKVLACVEAYRQSGIKPIAENRNLSPMVKGDNIPF